MSIFSRIRLDTQHPLAREALLQAGAMDPYAEHQWLWRFFPAAAGTARDFIFRRIDTQGGDQSNAVYTVSTRAPTAPHPAWSVESRPYQPALEEGDRLAFELRVNPVRSSRRADGSSKRHDVVMHAKKGILQKQSCARWADLPETERPLLYDIVQNAVSDWFCGTQKQSGVATRHGFDAASTDLRMDGYRQHRFYRKGGNPISVSTVDITGALVVTQPELALRALLEGIGHAKAFGCGLLLVRRAD